MGDQKRKSTAEPQNPFGRKLAALRATMVDSVTEDDLRAVLAKLLERAKAGDLGCIREVLNRAVGTPGEGRDPDRVGVEAVTLEADRYEAERLRRLRRPTDLDRLLNDDD
jgi:hypothetical protein